MQTIQKFSTWYSKQKLIGKLSIGCLGLVIFCCLCSVPVSILNPSTPTPKANIPSVAEVQSTPVAGAAEIPTSIPVTNTPAPIDTPTPLPAGESRSNPIPAGTIVKIGGDMTLTITNVTRPADSIVMSGNQFNTQPEANLEYLLVDIQVVCNKSSDDTCYFAASEMKAVGADGNVHEVESFIVGVDGLLESGEFFGGATRTGKMFFIVPKDDKSVVLFYDPMLFGNTIYLALP